MKRVKRCTADQTQRLESRVDADQMLETSGRRKKEGLNALALLRGMLFSKVSMSRPRPFAGAAPEGGTAKLRAASPRGHFLASGRVSRDFDAEGASLKE